LLPPDSQRVARTVHPRRGCATKSLFHH
jgi:hypothetical protein